MGFANACRIASIKVVSIQATHSSTLVALFFAEKRWHGNYSFNAFCCCFVLVYSCCFISLRVFVVVLSAAASYFQSDIYMTTPAYYGIVPVQYLFSVHNFNTIRSQNMNSNMWNWMCTAKQMNWKTHTQKLSEMRFNIRFAGVWPVRLYI